MRKIILSPKNIRKWAVISVSSFDAMEKAKKIIRKKCPPYAVLLPIARVPTDEYVAAALIYVHEGKTPNIEALFSHSGIETFNINQNQGDSKKPSEIENLIEAFKNAPKEPLKSGKKRRKT